MASFPLPVLTPPPAAPADAPGGVALRIVEEAVEEAAAIREAARQEGLEAGRRAARAEATEAVQALRAAAEALRAERDDVAAQAEEGAVELALAIAEQVLGAELQARPERVLDAVRGALRLIVERRRITVLVHPDDLGLVRSLIGDVLGELGGVEHCDVQAERRVARGGALVSTDEGTVDATLATKLTRVREVLADAEEHHDDDEVPAGA